MGNIKTKYNNFWLGITLGLIIPTAICAAALYLEYPKIAQLQNLGISVITTFVPKVLSLCVIANLLPFYFFLHFNAMKSVKGILTATFIIGAATLTLYLLK